MKHDLKALHAAAMKKKMTQPTDETEPAGVVDSAEEDAAETAKKKRIPPQFVKK
jgi:hypothetical protein